jgi:hypothetical protein
METGMSTAPATCVNLLRFDPRFKILHLAWLTFFVRKRNLPRRPDFGLRT